MNKDELLANLAQMRQDYPAFLEGVEADLAREKQIRTAKRLSEIRDTIIRAWVAGATIASLKRAYGTKDYRTIRNIIDTAEAEIEAIQAEADKLENYGWFDYVPEDRRIMIFDGDWTAEFTVQFMEHDIIMLASEDDLYPNGFDADPNPVVKQWDGEVILPNATGRSAEIYKAVYPK